LLAKKNPKSRSPARTRPVICAAEKKDDKLAVEPFFVIQDSRKDLLFTCSTTSLPLIVVLKRLVRKMPEGSDAAFAMPSSGKVFFLHCRAKADAFGCC
jgi:hypothetical protein